jgi:hypothetical protein
LCAWTFIQKWPSAGSLWYKGKNPWKINEPVRNPCLLDFPHLSFSYCYLCTNLKGKAYKNNPYNTKFSKIKHVSAVFSKNNMWGMAFSELGVMSVCVCVCARTHFQQFIIPMGPSNKEYQQISKYNPYLNTSYRWNGI